MRRLSSVIGTRVASGVAVTMGGGVRGIPAHAAARACAAAAAAPEAAPAAATEAADAAPKASAAEAAPVVAAAQKPVKSDAVSQAISFDPKTVDPHRLMFVTTKFFDKKNKSRPAAQRLLECIEEHMDALPTVFLADVAGSPWPAGVMTDAMRVALRRRVAKGALDLSGADVARVFVAWTKRPELQADVVFFKRLGKLLAFNINDIRDPLLLTELVQAITRAGLKPPAGFMALLMRRAVALDRLEPLRVRGALKLLTQLEEHDALDHATATALVNRVVLQLRASIETVKGIAPASTADAATAGAAAIPPEPKEAEAGDVESIAAAAGIPAEAAAVGLRETVRDSKRGWESAVAEAYRDTRRTLAGAPLPAVDLTAAEVKAVLEEHKVSSRRLLSFLVFMQDHGLTSPHYANPVVPLVLPGVDAMHPLEALRFIREGGLKRIIHQRMASKLFAKLERLDVDFSTRVLMLSSVYGFRRHVRRKAKAPAADSTAAGGASSTATAAVTTAEAVTAESFDEAMCNKIIDDVLKRIGNIESSGIVVKPLVTALGVLCDFCDDGMPELRERILAVFPAVTKRMRQLTSGGALLSECDAFLEVAARLKYEDAEGAAGDLAAVKAARQLAEDEGRESRFDCTVQGSKSVFRDLVVLTALVDKCNAAAEPVRQVRFDELRASCLARHPMHVLEALESFEARFPKALPPAIKREVARALIIKLRPGAPFSAAEGDTKARVRAVSFKEEEWPRFVDLARRVGPESLLTEPSFWKFVVERNTALGNDAAIAKYAGEMLTIFDRRR